MTPEQEPALDIVRRELDYRRNKQWNIFSWTVTILIAAIGGVVTLAANEHFSFPLLPHRFIMVAALSVLALYATRWITENIAFETEARDNVKRLLKGVDLSHPIIPDPGRDPQFGYVAVVRAMAVFAIAAVLLIDFGQYSWY